MSTKLFRAEDFDLPYGYAKHWTRDNAAERANARLAPLITALERLEEADQRNGREVGDAIYAVLSVYRALKEKE
jgi:hypothetical protein